MFINIFNLLLSVVDVWFPIVESFDSCNNWKTNYISFI